MGILGQQGEDLPQILHRLREARFVLIPLPRKGCGRLRVAPPRDQLNFQVHLADGACLSDGAAVKADEVGVFSPEITGENLIAAEILV